MLLQAHVDITYVASIDIIFFMSRVLVTVNEECGMEISRMEAIDSMTRHSPTKPSTDGSTNSISLELVVLDGESCTFRLPHTWTIWNGKYKAQK